MSIILETSNGISFDIDKELLSKLSRPLYDFINDIDETSYKDNVIKFNDKTYSINSEILEILIEWVKLIDELDTQMITYTLRLNKLRTYHYKIIDDYRTVINKYRDDIFNCATLQDKLKFAHNLKDTKDIPYMVEYLEKQIELDNFNMEYTKFENKYNSTLNSFLEKKVFNYNTRDNFKHCISIMNACNYLDLYY